MPPKSSARIPARTAFKPPRRLSSSPPIRATISKTATKASKPKPAATSKPPPPASRKRQKVIDFSDSDLDDDDDSLLDDFINDDDVESTTSEREELPVRSEASPSPTSSPGAASEDPAPPTIPRKLLARLLHEHFQNKDTQVDTEAMAVFGKYVEMFAREAIARALFEHEGEEGDGGSFLEVEDLEKLAPQLLLDF